MATYLFSNEDQIQDSIAQLLSLLWQNRSFKKIFPFPSNPYLKTDCTDLPILFLVKKEENEV